MLDTCIIVQNIHAHFSVNQSPKPQPMKQLFTLVCLFFVMIGNAKNYYISSGGDDANNGLTPATAWKTIGKLNSFFKTMAAGDSVLFKSGESFYGTINVGKAGTNGNKIVIGAFGNGVQPVITGFTTLSGWTNEGGGIYSKIITSEAQTNMVTMDGVQLAMGRYPDGNYLSYETFSSNISVTDNSLGNTINWTGAEIVIRKNDWTLDRCLITKHTGNTLSYTNLGSTQNATANFGYFIQNDLRTLSTLGEWYHNTVTGKFYMYFGSTDPNTKVIKVANINNLFYDNTFDYVTVENINFSGSIGNTIHFAYNNDYCTIQNCTIAFSGANGITFLHPNLSPTIDNNSVGFCNSIGISCDATSATISNNKISAIGLLPGQSLDNEGYAGIYSPGDGVSIKYNTIKNTGYNGITIRYKGEALIAYNYIDSACVVLDDGAGIYTSTPNTSIRRIDHNIVTNVIGNNYGTDNAKPSSAGIYLDETSTNVIVSGNTVANIPFAGIKLHKAHNNTITGNTSFNNTVAIGFEDYVGNNIRNNSLRRNVFFAKTATQNLLQWYTVTNDISLFGTADSNYYARPIDDNLSIYLRQPSTGYAYKSLSGWNTFTNQDSHSKKSPIAVTDINDIRFEYNNTQTVKTINLGAKYIGVDNTVYSGTIILQPYTSAVLIKTGIIEASLKADAGNDISLVLPINTTLLKGIATGNVTNYSWTKIAGPDQYAITSPSSPSTTITSLTIGKYIFQFKVFNSAGDSAIATVNVLALGVLPVTLIDFTAKNNNDKIALQWKVASEINLKLYAIERSSNGQTFENIGTVNAVNLFTDNGNYNFDDNFPLQGINYYRLVMVDKDGTTKYSKIISASQNNATSFKLNKLSLSANNNNFNIGINSNYQQEIQVVLSDVNGRLLFRKSITLQKGFNNVDNKIPAINTGVYFAKIFTAEQIITKTLLSGH